MEESDFLKSREHFCEHRKAERASEPEIVYKLVLCSFAFKAEFQVWENTQYDKRERDGKSRMHTLWLHHFENDLKTRRCVTCDAQAHDSDLMHSEFYHC